MISVVSFLMPWIRAHLRRSRKPQEAPLDRWVTFQWGRALDHRGDASGAFCCYLSAAQGLEGLPVAAACAWLAYRVGHGVHRDSLAAQAWGQRATELGWPDVLIGTVEGLGGHGHEVVVDP